MSVLARSTYCAYCHIDAIPAISDISINLFPDLFLSCRSKLTTAVLSSDRSPLTFPIDSILLGHEDQRVILKTEEVGTS